MTIELGCKSSSMCVYEISIRIPKSLLRKLKIDRSTLLEISDIKLPLHVTYFSSNVY